MKQVSTLEWNWNILDETQSKGDKLYAVAVKVLISESISMYETVSSHFTEIITLLKHCKISYVV